MSTPATLKRVVLGGQHQQPRRTRHTISDGRGVRDFPAFVSLEIVQYPTDNGYYLLHITVNGEVADIWHQSLEDAMHQAEFEFGVQDSE